MTDSTPEPTAASASEDTPPLQAFETSMAELEALVESLESGDMPLEDALARFERGVALSRQCQAMLKTAELRVDQLLGDGENEHVAELPNNDAPNA